MVGTIRTHPKHRPSMIKRAIENAVRHLANFVDNDEQARRHEDIVDTLALYTRLGPQNDPETLTLAEEYAAMLCAPGSLLGKRDRDAFAREFSN